LKTVGGSPLNKIKHFTFKVVVIGDEKVGKTTLCKNFLWGISQHEYKSAMGADFYMYPWYSYLDELKTKLHVRWLLFDLTGQFFEFQTIRPLFYRGAHAAIIVFDISRPETFKSIPVWIYEFWRDSSPGAVEKRPFIIAGNKADLRGTVENCLPRELAEDYVKRVAKGLNFEPAYVEVSVLHGWNTEDLLKKLLIAILKYYGYTDMLLKTSGEK